MKPITGKRKIVERKKRDDKYYFNYCTYNASPQEEVVLIHVKFPRVLKDLGTHLEGEEQLVLLKQASAGKPGWGRWRWRLILDKFNSGYKNTAIGY